MKLANIVDLETGGTTPGSAIFSIGAVIVDLDTGEFLSHYYDKINVNDAARQGLISVDTMLWWGKQEEMARNAVFQPDKTDVDLYDAIYEFGQWHTTHKAETIWGNGATFDVSMLEYFFVKFEIPLPWKFWDVRDLRTLRDLVGDKLKEPIPFEGIKHHALHDAFHEAKQASRMWQIAREALNA